MLIGEKTDLVKLSKALEKIIAAAPSYVAKIDDENNVYDYSGSNVDDAYALGLDRGYYDVAQEIKEALNND
jgi:hypothetical protein